MDEEIVEERCRRYYTSSKLATLKTDTASDADRQVLLALYDQIHATWRQLVEVRFKLLGLVPTVSSALLLLILSRGDEEPSAWGKVLLAMLGLLVTLGLMIYDRRNTQLYNDLVSRGRKIEEELGVDTGIFRGRLNASGFIKHDVGMKLIYRTCLLAWLAALALLIVEWS